MDLRDDELSSDFVGHLSTWDLDTRSISLRSEAVRVPVSGDNVRDHQHLRAGVSLKFGPQVKRQDSSFESENSHGGGRDSLWGSDGHFKRKKVSISETTHCVEVWDGGFRRSREGGKRIAASGRYRWCDGFLLAGLLSV